MTVATAAPPLALRSTPAFLPSISKANFPVDEPLVAAGMLILLGFKYSALWPGLLGLVSQPTCVVRNKHCSLWELAALGEDLTPGGRELRPFSGEWIVRSIRPLGE